MTETTFLKNMKKWFWSFFLGQAAIFFFTAIWFSSTISSTVAKHETDIMNLQLDIKTKADITTVMRIKADNDRVSQMILDNTKELKEGQVEIYNLLFNHLNKK